MESPGGSRCSFLFVASPPYILTLTEEWHVENVFRDECLEVSWPARESGHGQSISNENRYEGERIT